MKRLMIVMACAVTMFACAKVQEAAPSEEPLMGDSESVIATAKDFDFGAVTKTSITQSGSEAPKFAWKQGDVIGVIPMNGKTVQSNYEIAEIGSNPKQALFDGGVWALKEGKEYAAYYPFNEQIARSGDNLEFSFLGQTQAANNSLEHLGAFDYMYASAVVPQGGNAQFDFEHKISLVRLQLTVPEADTYTRVVLESSESWFASGASLKLSDGTMTATEAVKSASISLNDIQVSANGVLTVWFAALPTSALSGQTLSVKLFGSENACTGEITGITSLNAGSAYSYAVTLSSDGPEVEYVDLGLSVKWATCNLGAKSIGDFGDYYAWGEVETKDYYDGSTYKFIKVQHIAATEDEYDSDGFLIREGRAAHDEYRYTKYVPQSMADSYGFEGFYDDKTVLDPEDDVAHVTLGGKWRMPTKEEFNELINNCQCDWVTYKGVKGRKFTSKKSGYTDKWIFMPAAGYRYNDYLEEVGSGGIYWSSSLLTGYPVNAYELDFSSGNVHSSDYYRFSGLSVRPVSE